MSGANRWFLEGEKKRKEAAKKQKSSKSAVSSISNLAEAGKQAIKDNPSLTRSSSSSNRNSDNVQSGFQRNGMRNSRLGTRRAGTYNGEFSDDIINFFKGNAKQFGGTLASTVGRTRRKVGGSDIRSLMDAQQEEIRKALKSGNRYYGTKIMDAAKKRA